MLFLSFYQSFSRNSEFNQLCMYLISLALIAICIYLAAEYRKEIFSFLRKQWPKIQILA